MEIPLPLLSSVPPACFVYLNLNNIQTRRALALGIILGFRITGMRTARRRASLRDMTIKKFRSLRDSPDVYRVGIF